MRRRAAIRGRAAAWAATLVLAAALQAEAATADPHARHRAIAGRAKLVPCAARDLDCRGFVGTLAWRPDERRPLLSSKALRRLALLRRVPGGQRERALRCLAFVAWAEARSEGVAGMRAVVAVVLNRSRSPSFPAHPCEVIGAPGAFEPLLRDGYRTTALALKRRELVPFPRPRSAVDAAALQVARLMVWRMAKAAANDDPTDGATHFLAPQLLRARGQPIPAWTRGMLRTARIGAHDFFRLPDLQLARQP